MCWKTLFQIDEPWNLWHSGWREAKERRILHVSSQTERFEKETEEEEEHTLRGCRKYPTLNGIYRTVLHTRFANELIHYYNRDLAFSFIHRFTDQKILRWIERRSILSFSLSLSFSSFLLFRFIIDRCNFKSFPFFPLSFSLFSIICWRKIKNDVYIYIYIYHVGNSMLKVKSSRSFSSVWTSGSSASCRWPGQVNNHPFFLEATTTSCYAASPRLANWCLTLANQPSLPSADGIFPDPEDRCRSIDDNRVFGAKYLKRYGKVSFEYFNIETYVWEMKINLQIYLVRYSL